MSRHVLFALFALLTLPSIAFAADALGPQGAIRELEIATPHADVYLQYHGRAVVVSGKSTAEYRWGGTSCGTKVLTDAEVAALQRGMGSGLQVVPRFVDGQGGTLCLVGFAFVD